MHMHMHMHMHLRPQRDEEGGHEGGSVVEGVRDEKLELAREPVGERCQ